MHGAAVGGDEEIEVAVAVKIAKRHAAADLRGRKLAAHLGGGVAEASGAIVDKQARHLGMRNPAAEAAHGVVDVTVGDHQLQVAVEIEVGKHAAEAQAFTRRHAHARRHRAIHIAAAGRRFVQAQHFVVEVRHRNAHAPGALEVTGVDAHAGACAAVFTEGHAQRHGRFGERAVAVVAIELVRLRVVGNEQVGPAVGIHVEHRHAERFRRRVEDAALGRDIFKRAIALVAEQPAGGAAIRLGCAVRLGLAVKRAMHVLLGRPTHVVADEEVKLAVAIEIKPERGGGEGAARAEAGRVGDVGKAALAIVAEQPVLAHRRDVEVGEAVVVEVSHGHAEAIHFDVKARLACHIREATLAIVAQQAHGGAAALMPRPILPVQQQDVQPAVVVIVEKRAARSHCFGQKLCPVRAGFMAKLDPRRRRDIGEPEAGIGRRGAGQRGKKQLAARGHGSDTNP